MSAEFAGTLSERVTIERLSEARDAKGLQEEAWETLCSCRASVAPDGVGAESLGQALSAMPRYRITIRRREGIAPGQRVLWGERRMAVRQLLDDPRAKDRIMLRCEEMR